MNKHFRAALIWHLQIITLAILPIAALGAQDAPRTTVEFNNNVIEFEDFPDIIVSVSEPFIRYQKWDTAHTGDSWFSIALELTNNSDQLISAVNFITRLYNNKGILVSESTNATGPMTFEPQDGNVLKPGYRGVYEGFITKDSNFYDEYGKLELEITEVKTASKAVADGPVFSDNWLSYEEYPGLEFQLSEPYRFLNDLSGEEMFTIAMKFKNKSDKPVQFIYFFVRIFDDIGPLYELEKQEHNQKYDPPPGNFFATDFPAGYEGINVSFYRSDLSLFDVFNKIEIMLINVE